MTRVTEQRRQSRRIACNFSFRGGGGSANLSGRITDLSGTGVFLATPRVLPPGKQVHLEFQLPTGQVEAVGEVRWAAKDAKARGLGIRFLRLSAASARAIDDALGIR